MAITRSPPATILARVRPPGDLRPQLMVPGLGLVGLLLVWAVSDGGYDTGTWYWGALLALGAVAAVLVLQGWREAFPSRWARWALAAFAGYVVWSYASIAWAGSPGDALLGSNRALLYLLIFGLALALPWSGRGALAALTVYTVGVGLTGVVLLVRLATASDLPALVIGGRLAAPTGYFNATVALFMIEALLAIALSSRRELPGLARGLLCGFAAVGLQLAVIGQSRGWLFTLPLVAILAIVLVRDRLRVGAAAVLPVAAAAIPVHRLLAVYSDNAHLVHAASVAGHAALLFSAATFLAATMIAWAESLFRPPSLSRAARRWTGGLAAALALGVGVGGFVAATHGDPTGFISRQWRGFSHPPTAAPSGSHFATVGSGRYDFWRVSLDALVAYPVGGLGQDNFADYYITRRRTGEEPSWTHSLELRLLAHTGLVGFVLFGGFLLAAVAGAVLSRRRAAWPLGSAVAGASLLPLVVWLVHGSVDWFWEVPALTGPALVFLAVAISLRGPAAPDPWEEAPEDEEELETEASGLVFAPPRRRALDSIGRRLIAPGAAVLLLALVVVLGFPYLAVREEAAAQAARTRNPAAALADLRTAAKLDPLSPLPGRLGGTIALSTGRYIEAEQEFAAAIRREPGGWFSYFGDGLAASALGETARASRDYRAAVRINAQAIGPHQALARVDSLHPMTPSEGLATLVLSD